MDSSAICIGFSLGFVARALLFERSLHVVEIRTSSRLPALFVGAVVAASCACAYAYNIRYRN